MSLRMEVLYRIEESLGFRLNRVSLYAVRSKSWDESQHSICVKSIMIVKFRA